MPKHQKPTTRDPVAEIAHQVVALFVASAAKDTESLTAGPERKEDLRRLILAIGERINAMEEAASHLRAASPAGALFQIMLAFEAVDFLHDLVPPTAEGQAAKLHARIDRCLYSAVAALAAATGADPAAVGGDWYMTPELDRSRKVAEALAA